MNPAVAATPGERQRVAAHLTAPVGRLLGGDGEVTNRAGELVAVRLDRGANLFGAALGAHAFLRASVTAWRVAWASAIAMVGTGDEPFFSSFTAMNPANAPSATKMSVASR